VKGERYERSGNYIDKKWLPERREKASARRIYLSPFTSLLSSVASS